MANTTCQLQAITHVKSLDTSTQSINRSDR